VSALAPAPINEPDPNDLGKALVEKMTNYQRTQWTKAGYPGLSNSHYEADKIRPFLSLSRVSR